MSPFPPTWSKPGRSLPMSPPMSPCKHKHQPANVRPQMQMRSKPNKQEPKMMRHQKASKTMSKTRKRREKGLKKRGSNLSKPYIHSM